MARYLLVAHQTADSLELRSRVVELIQKDPAAEFVLLVPATPVGLLPTIGGETRSAVQVARMRASRAQALLQEAGARVAAARIGNYDPFVAVQEELRGGNYDTIVISTLPPGLSRWLRQDLPAKVARHFPNLQLVHVIAHPTAASTA